MFDPNNQERGVFGQVIILRRIKRLVPLIQHAYNGTAGVTDVLFDHIPALTVAEFHPITIGVNGNVLGENIDQLRLDFTVS